MASLFSDYDGVGAYDKSERHKPQTENASSYKPGNVTLIDGRRVPSGHIDWLRECEAREVLKWPRYKQREFMEMVDRKRGIGAAARLKAMMSYCEPDFVLRLATREARRAYLELLGSEVGMNSREHLEQRIRTLYEQRKANACAAVAQ